MGAKLRGKGNVKCNNSESVWINLTMTTHFIPSFSKMHFMQITLILGTFGSSQVKGQNFLTLPKIWVLIIKMLKISHKSDFCLANSLIS